MALGWAAVGVACSGGSEERLDAGEEVPPDGGGNGDGPTLTIYPTQLTLWEGHRARVFAKVGGASDAQVTWSWDVQIPGTELAAEGPAGLVTIGNLSGRSELRAALQASAEVTDVIHVFKSVSSGCCIELVPQAPDDVDRVRVRPGGVLSIAAANAVRAIGQPRLPTLARIPLEIVDGPAGASLAPDGTFSAPSTEGVVRILGNPGHSGRILEIIVTADAPHTFAVVPAYARVASGTSVSLGTTDTGGADVAWELTTLAGLWGTSPEFTAPEDESGFVLVRAFTPEGVEAFGLIEYP